MVLLPAFLAALGRWQRSFVDYRTYNRAAAFALAFLTCLGRRTISRAICARGEQYKDWGPEYHFFSDAKWKPEKLFDAVIEQAEPLMSRDQPLTVALDDTICRKTGRRIPWSKYLRDPLSPKFSVNLVWALRYLHAGLLIWPARAHGQARAIPIRFQLAPPVPQPQRPRAGKKIDRSEKIKARREYRKAMREYRRRQGEEGLSACGAKLLNDLRIRFDRLPAFCERLLWAVVDASFCNRTVFRLLGKRIVLIGRTRKDIRLYGPPAGEACRRGRTRSYGAPLLTPDEIRLDQRWAWQTATVFGAGKRHQLQFKTVAPVLWRSGCATRPLRLIVVRPLKYRAHGHTLYRHPAYLLVSDPTIDPAQALQAYFYRWEIEVDQKEEKDLLGIGQAQVWSEQSVVRQPAFHIAAYAMLLVAAIKAYGLNSVRAIGRLPLWRRNKPPTRQSAQHLISQLRSDIQSYERSQADGGAGRRRSGEFRADHIPELNGKKLPVSSAEILASAWT